MTPAQHSESGLLAIAETMTCLVLERSWFESALMLIACGAPDPQRIAEDALRGRAA